MSTKRFATNSPLDQMRRRDGAARLSRAGGTTTTAIRGFGGLLQTSPSIEELGSNSAAAQSKLDEFDTAIAKLGTYKLAAAQLNSQRAGLVTTGPGVSDVLRRFITAAAAGDIAQPQQLVPEVTSAISKFQAAATNAG